MQSKETKKYTSVFGLFLPLKAKKSGSEAADRLLQSPILLVIAGFLPKMQEKPLLSW
ncbi:hypothetical protein [uncultured Fibrobacter sp.]|uniref:hypothetical protein n=1 Tax=uncultured Fibrobacter sp. TaxID=261512 RepID=UPI0025F50894|nr:hypothetical protein [uncultured Fibrobacter sp.]